MATVVGCTSTNSVTPKETQSLKQVAGSSEGINYDGATTCVVTFRVYADLLPGQYVKVLGSDNHLGWDFACGLNLNPEEPDGANTQGWVGSIKLPKNTTFEYKYVVCHEQGLCFSLSTVQRAVTKKKPLVLDDGEFTRQEGTNNKSPSHQLMVQLDVPPSYSVKAGHAKLGITLHNGEKLERVTVSARDYASKELEASLLREAHDISTFNFQQSGDVHSLLFEVKTISATLRAVVLTSQLFSSHHGVVTTPLLDAAFSVMGEMVFRYLIVTPFSHTKVVHSSSAEKRMAIPVPRASSSLLIGHRGTGAAGSRKLIDGKFRSHVRENTVLSFATAGAQGAEIVEFDVHLTSDLVPVIYHDFSTHTQEAQVPIHCLTYEKFTELGRRKIVKTNSLEDLKHIKSSSDPIHDNFPTLREVLQKVPKNIGFNVEIKYPIEDEIQKFDVHPVNRNTYLDCILWEIYEHAKDRFIVFSSFDPDICYMLIQKQPHYPVFFLTELGTQMRSDPRSNSVDASIHFANSIGLSGLVCPARHLVQNPAAVAAIRGSGLHAWTWGRDNNDPANILAQQKIGVDGIIADHVRYVSRNWPQHA